MNVLGIILARGGSKGIPQKNIKKLLGTPLVAYTIVPALKSKFITDVVVSSDDDNILKISKNYGAIALKRPKYLAGDRASSIDAVIHAVLRMEKQNKCRYDYVILLQPTTPTRSVKHIDEALKKLISSKADSVISVVKSPAISPEWMKYIVKGKLVDIDPQQKEGSPRQRNKIYVRNGAIYATTRNVLVKDKTFKGKDCRPYVMPVEIWVNIDTMRDWQMAEIIMRENNVKINE